MALALVQTLEPCGVGARSLQECLSLQVEMIPDPCQRDMAVTIIQEHMDLLASRDYAGLCAVLKRDQDDVRAVCERIRRMAPHPGWRFDNSSVQYVIPDVIAERRQGKWQASLNPAAIPLVRMNHRYATLFQRQRDQGHQALFEQLREARWTMRNISQRFQTILDVASAILRRQHRFLEYGPVGMKPLGLQEIAQELGLHESTVSRAVNGKYMATTTGMFELRQFFSRSLPTHNGGMCSAVAMRGIIQDMIEHEDPHDPYSDAEISRQLARQGLAVARRTVTKYRQGMKIQAVAMRRRN